MKKTNSKKRPLLALQIIGDSKFGGGTIVVCNMMKMLQAHGVEVEVLATDSDLRLKMGICGLERVNREFKDVKIAEFLHEFYLSHLQSSGGN